MAEKECLLYGAESLKKNIGPNLGDGCAMWTLLQVAKCLGLSLLLLNMAHSFFLSKVMSGMLLLIRVVTYASPRQRKYIKFA